MINNFRGKYFFLSNFYPVSIIYEGITYSSSEHAYQAAKFIPTELKDKIRVCKSPGEAKNKATELKIFQRTDWHDINIGIMFNILRIKFTDTDLKNQLINTGTKELIEGNWWNDTFWGISKGIGENWLGKTLMAIRYLSK